MNLGLLLLPPSLLKNQESDFTIILDANAVGIDDAEITNDVMKYCESVKSIVAQYFTKRKEQLGDRSTVFNFLKNLLSTNSIIVYDLYDYISFQVKR